MDERKEYTVTYYLTDEQTKQLSRITELYNNIARPPSTPESLFSSLMQMGSIHAINDKFNFFERNFTANQPGDKTA